MVADDSASGRLPLTDSLRLERAVDSFEDAWQHGAKIEAFSAEVFADVS